MAKADAAGPNPDTGAQPQARPYGTGAYGMGPYGGRLKSEHQVEHAAVEDEVAPADTPRKEGE